MTTVNMLEAKINLSRLVAAVESGAETEIVIAGNGRPAARLVALIDIHGGQRLGIAEGQFTVPQNIDWSNELIAALFVGGRD